MSGPIALEVRALSGPAGGVVRYIRGLLGGLLALDSRLALLLLCDHPRGLKDSTRVRGIAVPPSQTALRLWWDGVALPNAVRRTRASLLHLTKPSGTPFKRGLPPVVTTVYDVIPLDHPETQTVVQRVYWSIQLPLAVRTATHILTISEFSKRRISERFGVPPEHITVTYPGIAGVFSPPAEAAVASLRALLGLDRPYVLTVGTIEPRKNVDVLLRAFARIARTVPHELVIAGRWGWKVRAVEEAARDPRLHGRVRFLGPVAASDLPVLYGGAEVFVSLSRAEGFGFPPLEAMACGCPVMVSDSGSSPETVGVSGTLVSPDDEEHVAGTLLGMLGNSTQKEHARKAGIAQAQRFTWEKTATRTLSVYRELLGGSLPHVSLPA